MWPLLLCAFLLEDVELLVVKRWVVDALYFSPPLYCRYPRGTHVPHTALVCGGEAPAGAVPCGGALKAGHCTALQWPQRSPSLLVPLLGQAPRELQMRSLSAAQSQGQRARCTLGLGASRTLFCDPPVRSIISFLSSLGTAMDQNEGDLGPALNDKYSIRPPAVAAPPPCR